MSNFTTCTCISMLESRNFFQREDSKGFFFQGLGGFQGLFSGILQCELNKSEFFRRGCVRTLHPTPTDPHMISKIYHTMKFSYLMFYMNHNSGNTCINDKITIQLYTWLCNEYFVTLIYLTQKPILVLNQKWLIIKTL